MKEWFSASELAGVSGLPGTRRAVLMAAARHEWQSRNRAGRGGGREYYIGSLPDSARVALRMRHRHHDAPAAPVVADRTANDAEMWAAYERKSDKVKAEASRRVNALFAVEELVKSGTPRLDAYATVAAQTGDCTSTIRNWYRAVKDAAPNVWAPLLMPKHVGRTATADYAEELYQLFRDAYLHPSRPAMTTCYHRIGRIAAAKGLTMPSYATLCRDLKRREPVEVIVLEREGERALADMFPWLERDRSVFHAMEAVNADGHLLDIAVEWEDGEKTRAMMMTVQDLASGAIVGCRLAKAESAHEMSLMFLDVFDRVGIAEHLYLDNTLAAAAKRNTAGAPGRKRFRDKEDDPKGVFPLLGVNVHFVQVAHGQSKPIERAFRSLAELISKHPAFEGAYLGNNTLNKPSNYGQRTVPVSDVRRIVEQEIIVFNTQRGRRGGVANGRSYLEVFDASYAQNATSIRRIAPSQRRLLYLIADRVRVQRDGSVRVHGNRYWTPELTQSRGKDVVVRYHPTESLHAAVYVYHLDGTLIAEAPVVHKVGFNTATAAETHGRAKGQVARATKHLAKARRRLKATEVMAMVPAPIAPDSPAFSAQRIDFALPTTPEQLGKTGSIERRASSARVNAAMEKLATMDGLIAPKRKRA